MPPKKRNRGNKNSTASAEPEGISTISALPNLDIFAICHGDVPLPDTVSYQQVKALLQKLAFSDEKIQDILLGFVLNFTDIVTRNILSRALIEMFTGPIPFPVIDRCVAMAHKACMARFPVDGDQSDEQKVLYRKIKTQREKDPLTVLLLFIFNSIANQYGYLEKSCHKRSGRYLHELNSAHSDMLRYLLSFMTLLAHHSIDSEIIEKLAGVPIFCGMATLVCARELFGLGLVFQVVDFFNEKTGAGHSILLIGGPDTFEEKEKVLLSDVATHAVVLLNPYRREVLKDEAASGYYRVHKRSATRTNVTFDSRLPNFNVLCHARAQLKSFFERLLDAYYKDDMVMRHLLLTEAKKWRENRGICRLHIQGGLTPNMADLGAVMKLLEGDISAPLLKFYTKPTPPRQFFSSMVRQQQLSQQQARKRSAAVSTDGDDAEEWSETKGGENKKIVATGIDVMVQQGGMSLTLKLACAFLSFILTALLLHLYLASMETYHAPSP